MHHMFSYSHYLSEAEMRGGESGAQVDRALVVLLGVVVVAAGVVGAAQQIVRLCFHRFVLGVPSRRKHGYGGQRESKMREKARRKTKPGACGVRRGASCALPVRRARVGFHLLVVWAPHQEPAGGVAVPGLAQLQSEGVTRALGCRSLHGVQNDLFLQSNNGFR